MNELTPAPQRADSQAPKEITRRLIIDGLRQMEAVKAKLKDALDSLKIVA